MTESHASLGICAGKRALEDMSSQVRPAFVICAGRGALGCNCCARVHALGFFRSQDMHVKLQLLYIEVFYIEAVSSSCSMCMWLDAGGMIRRGRHQPGAASQCGSTPCPSLLQLLPSSASSAPLSWKPFWSECLLLYCHFSLIALYSRLSGEPL